MKSHPSISPVRRALVAATVVLATSSIAVFAQSTSSQGSSSTQGTSGSSGSSSWNSGTSGTSSSSYSPSTSGTYNPSSGSAGTSGTSQMGTSDTDMSSSRMTSQQPQSMTSQKLSWGDRRFVTKAAEDGQEEIQLAQLAAQKAQNPDVKNYAQQLVQGHSQVNQELMSIANQRNVKVEREDSNTRTYRRLNNASAQEFDREFIEHMVDMHEKDVKSFEKAASDAKDPQVRQFASRHVSALRQHLQQAQQLQRSVVPTGDEENSGQSWRSQSSSQTTPSSQYSTPSSSSTGTSHYSTGSSSGTQYGTGTSTTGYGSSSGASGSSSGTTR